MGKPLMLPKPTAAQPQTNDAKVPTLASEPPVQRRKRRFDDSSRRPFKDGNEWEQAALRGESLVLVPSPKRQEVADYVQDMARKAVQRGVQKGSLEHQDGRLRLSREYREVVRQRIV